MIKKQLTTIFLSLALVATTAFQPISISAADNLRTETKISLHDRSKKQSTKPIGYTFESKHISTSSKAKGKGATKASSVDSMTYTWDENTQTLRVSGRGKVVGNYDNRNDLAQYQNQAKKIILEKGITEIGKNAFAQFYNLSEIEFPSTLTKIGEAAFLECDKLTSATLPTSLKVLDRAAFANCSALVNVTIPSQLTTMRDYAFQRCAIKNITIPATLKTFSELAFFECYDFQKIEVASGHPSYSTSNGVLFNKNKTKLVLYPVGKQAASYQIPNSVKEIGKNALNHARVGKIVIPTSVSKIGEGAFAGATIISLNIPNSVRSAGYYICEKCTQLKTVTFGNGLTTIPYRMFYNCVSLTSVSMGNNIKKLDGLVFGYCSSLKQIKIPDSVISLGDGCFGECSALTTINFPKNLNEIAYQTFFNCKSLTSVTFSNTLQMIGSLAFYGTKIKKVRIPASVIYVGTQAFPAESVIEGLNGLQKIEDGSYMRMEKLPIKVTYDYKAAFDIVKRVNSERRKKGLKALTMDRRMIKGSMIRAAELAIAFSHIRPSGRFYYSVCYDSKLGYIMSGENIAAGQTSSRSVMTSWMNSDGHRANILTDRYTGIGVGAVKVNGICYWVQNFSTAAVDAAEESSYKNNTATTNIEVTKAQIGYLFSVNPINSFSLKNGTSKNISYSIYNHFVNVPLISSEMKYKVSSPSICKVSASGKITGLKAGKTSVTITPKQAPSFAKTITITVTDTSLGKVTWGKCKRSSKTVQLQWKKVSGATSYQVYRFKGKKWVRVTTTKKTSYKYKKAPKNGSYKVRAVKTSGKKKIYGAFSKVKKIK